MFLSVTLAKLTVLRLNKILTAFYRGADKSLARPETKQANVSVRMAWISFCALTCVEKKTLMTARVSMLLKSRASLTCFRACFLHGRTKYYYNGMTLKCQNTRSPSEKKAVVRAPERKSQDNGCLPLNIQTFSSDRTENLISRKSIRKGSKSVPLQAWNGPESSRKLRSPDFMTTAQNGGKFVSLTHRPSLPPGNTPGTHFC